MNSHSSVGAEHSLEAESETDIECERVTIVNFGPSTSLPPADDDSPDSEPPPTARWTPPPALLASVCPGAR